jgi:hypothetical protein
LLFAHCFRDEEDAMRRCIEERKSEKQNDDVGKNYGVMLIKGKQSVLYRTKSNIINISHDLEYCK